MRSNTSAKLMNIILISYYIRYLYLCWFIFFKRHFILGKTPMFFIQNWFKINIDFMFIWNISYKLTMMFNGPKTNIVKLGPLIIFDSDPYEKLIFQTEQTLNVFIPSVFEWNYSNSYEKLLPISLYLLSKKNVEKVK